MSIRITLLFSLLREEDSLIWANYEASKRPVIIYRLGMGKRILVVSLLNLPDFHIRHCKIVMIPPFPPQHANFYSPPLHSVSDD